uniref:Uncharacterized protein n=1 Tax=Salix viminalis TaxID=40686 RepID=A0A6N2K8F5_SALVM
MEIGRGRRPLYLSLSPCREGQGGSSCGGLWWSGDLPERATREKRERERAVVGEGERKGAVVMGRWLSLLSVAAMGVEGCHCFLAVGDAEVVEGDEREGRLLRGLLLLLGSTVLHFSPTIISCVISRRSRQPFGCTLLAVCLLVSCSSVPVAVAWKCNYSGGVAATMTCLQSLGESAH